MRKSIDLMTTAMRHTRFHVRGLDPRPHKPLKHRYERRKVRECLRLSDWFAEE
jgi:hypothetical protein